MTSSYLVLFMGSDKYPGENEFDSFVSTHGGTNNANTDYETVHNYWIRLILDYYLCCLHFLDLLLF